VKKEQEEEKYDKLKRETVFLSKERDVSEHRGFSTRSRANLSFT
jgi:hypothetical protein